MYATLSLPWCIFLIYPPKTLEIACRTEMGGRQSPAVWGRWATGAPHLLTSGALPLVVPLVVQGEQRELRNAMLHEIQTKINNLETANGHSSFGRKRKGVGEEDGLRRKIIRANERLMNLDYVMPDDDIKSDLDTIAKVRGPTGHILGAFYALTLLCWPSAESGKVEKNGEEAKCPLVACGHRGWQPANTTALFTTNAD